MTADVLHYIITEILPAAVGGVLGGLAVMGWLYFKDR